MKTIMLITAIFLAGKTMPSVRTWLRGTHWRRGHSTLLTLLLGITGPLVLPVAGQSVLRLNPLQIALLKWSPDVTTSYDVGINPIGVAFDGGSIWVVNNFDETVTKLRASDGAIEGTFALGSGSAGPTGSPGLVVNKGDSDNATGVRAPESPFDTGPTTIAYAGGNMWIVNGGSNNVTKVRTSDGAVQGIFSVGTFPQGVAFDGANIWVANAGSNNVTKLRASDGALVGTFTVGTSPIGIAFDGANIWVGNAGSNTVTKLRASDGALLGTFSVGAFPKFIAFDGANIWVVNAQSGNVTKLRASDGALQGTFSVGSFPVGIAFDGVNIWVANAVSNSVTELRARDGALQGTFSVGVNPTLVAFDGANIWVTNLSSQSVNKL